MADGPTISCEKCKQGTMLSTRVARMGDGLRVLGFILWVPALALLLLSTACGMFVGGSTAVSTSEQVTRVRNQTSDQLRDVASVPSDAVEAFRTSGNLDPAVVASLSGSDRQRVDRILSLYTASMAGTGLGTAAATGAIGLGVGAVFVACVPLLIVGLLLTRKKNVWRCPTCGYVFDRA